MRINFEGIKIGEVFYYQPKTTDRRVSDLPKKIRSVVTFISKTDKIMTIQLESANKEFNGCLITVKAKDIDEALFANMELF